MADRKVETVAQWLLRVALAAAFVSAVADRFGLWGAPGEPGVAWGAWAPFLQYVAKLNWFLPAALIPAVGWIATIAELILAAGLLIGWQLRWFAYASALLLLLFALTMVVASGPKAPLDYSVFTGVAGALLLGAVASHRQDVSTQSSRSEEDSRSRRPAEVGVSA